MQKVKHIYITCARALSTYAQCMQSIQTTISAHIFLPPHPALKRTRKWGEHQRPSVIWHWGYACQRRQQRESNPLRLCSEASSSPLRYCSTAISSRLQIANCVVCVSTRLRQRSRRSLQMWNCVSTFKKLITFSSGGHNCVWWQGRNWILTYHLDKLSVSSKPKKLSDAKDAPPNAFITMPQWDVISQF